MDEQSLRRIIRDKMTAGVLPRRPPAKMWGGRGTRHTCAVCEQQIDADGLEIETQEPGGVSMYFHVDCYTAWRSEIEAM